MTGHGDRVARGRAARRKGHQAERDLATYLRRWWPGAERKPDNGWRSSDRESADHGDIRGTGPIVWQVKHCKDFRPDEFLRETETQAVAAGADYGILVQRRDGIADPGRWWAWLPMSDLAFLAAMGIAGPVTGDPTLSAPVRVELRHVVTLLADAGYTPRSPASESPADTRPAPTTLGSAESG